MPNNCPVCNSDCVEGPTNKTYDKDGKKLAGIYINCKRCGEYALSGSLSATITNELNGNQDNIGKISNYIRRNQLPGLEPYLYSYTVTNIIENTSIPNPAEQINNAILWLGNNIPGLGEEVRLLGATHQSVVGSVSVNGFLMILKYLENENIIEGKIHGQTYQALCTLTIKGWKYYEDLKKGSVTSRKAFMAMKYGDPVLDKIVNDIFKPAVGATGFELIRLDDSPRAGLIDDKLRVEIRTSKFLISDLTHSNSGAYWEAGFAEGLGKPVIYTCEKSKFESEKTHFDTNHHLTVLWEEDALSEVYEMLKATIRATLPLEAKMTDDYGGLTKR